ncbi:30945_t:CDS:1, partial [Gigaspora margarita]
PIYNLIVIDLSHYDDKENEAFLNATLPFEQFIFINYEDGSNDNSDNYSLSLRSTSNSSSSKHQTKRDIELWFLGGEGVAIENNTDDSLCNVYCSAGFSAIHPSNFSKYIFTSARCLPNNTREILHAVWDSPVASRVPFGVIK